MWLFAFGFLAYVCVAGFWKLRAKVTPPAVTVPLGTPIPMEGEFGRLCRLLEAEGFTAIGDFRREMQTGPGESVAVLRGYLSPQRDISATVFRLSSAAQAGSSVTVLDLVSKPDEARSLTTSTSPSGVFLPDPARPTFRHPEVEWPLALILLHRLHVVAQWGKDCPLLPYEATGYAERVDAVSLRQYRYQASRGMFREGPPGYFAWTDKFALRGIANYFVGLGDPNPWLSPLFVSLGFALAAGGTLIVRGSLGLLLAGAGGAVAGAQRKGALLWVVLLAGLTDLLRVGRAPSTVVLLAGMVTHWAVVALRAGEASQQATRDRAL
jgi:hypothetical protein